MTFEIEFDDQCRPGDLLAAESELQRLLNSTAISVMGQMLSCYDTHGEPLQINGQTYTSKGKSPGTYQCYGGPVTLLRESLPEQCRRKNLLPHGGQGTPCFRNHAPFGQAIAGKARARRGLVRIIGQMAWPRETSAGAQPWGDAVFPAMVEKRALVFYRAILGGQGAARKREDGTVVRRGLSEKVRARLTTPDERRLAVEGLTRRVQHFTKGMFLGSRAFIDGWFERNREICRGRSRTERKQGAKSLGRPALRGLYTLRSTGMSTQLIL